MDALAQANPPPKPADLPGWRRVIADGRLGAMSLEVIASTLQDLGPHTDARVRNALARYLSDYLYRLLRAHTWTSHPNRGQDIIDRVHVQLFEALARPGCADAKDMRTKFKTVALYRLKDAIAAEARAHRVLDEDKAHEKKKQKKERKEPEKVEKETELAPLEEHPDLAADDSHEDEDTFRPGLQRDSTLMDGARDIDEQIDVDRFLEIYIPDYRKRLAFRLFMNGVPYRSNKATSIARAVGVDEGTARKWIKGIQEELGKRKGKKS
jgi:hypothetical protein